MTLKYRLLLAVLLTLFALGCQVSLAQTKTTEKDFTIYNAAACNCNLSFAPVLTNATACNLNNGSIKLTPSGGSGVLEYLWKDASGTAIATTKDINGIATGYYFLEVKDVNAPYCGTYYFNYTLTSNLVITHTAKDNNGCVTANGAINITGSGGSGNYAYAWQFPDGTSRTVRNISNVKAGSYSIAITDNVSGCIATKSISVKSNSQLVVQQDSEIKNTSCASPNGALNVTITNGSGQYVTTWYDMHTYGLAGSAEDLSGKRGGLYSIYAYDKVSGCTVYQYLNLSEQTTAPSFAVAEVVANTSCGSNNGAALLDISGTPGPYTVTWMDELNNVKATGQNPVALAPGTYGFRIMDESTKCERWIAAYDPDAVVIEDESLPTIHVTVNDIADNTGCGVNNGSIRLNVVDPLVPYTITWTGPNGFTSTQEDITGIGPGDYKMVLTSGCNTPPVIACPHLFTASQAYVTVNLLDIISDSENNLDISSIKVIDQPLSRAKAIITNDNVMRIDYAGVTFKGADQLRIRACDLLNACTENLINIEVDESGGVIVYNAVSPNSPGDNKFMRIENLPHENRVAVFNRWGDKVYEAVGYDNDTRKFEGQALDGKNLPTGTYFYEIELPNGGKSLQGYLVLKWL